MLDDQDKQDLRDRIDLEGSMEYTFRHYSNFKYEKKKDPQFARLVEDFCKAAERLEKYLGIEY